VRQLIAALLICIAAGTTAGAIAASAAGGDPTARAAQSWHTVHKSLRTTTQACRYTREGTLGIDVRSTSRADSPRRVSAQTMNTKYDDRWSGDRAVINPRQTNEWFTAWFYEGDYTWDEQLVRFKISTRKGQGQWTAARTWASIPRC
jgi:hypothetical protein